MPIGFSWKSEWLIRIFELGLKISHSRTSQSCFRGANAHAANFFVVNLPPTSLMWPVRTLGLGFALSIVPPWTLPATGLCLKGVIFPRCAYLPTEIQPT
jgi:hypothetical protein